MGGRAIKTETGGRHRPGTRLPFAIDSCGSHHRDECRHDIYDGRDPASLYSPFPADGSPTSGKRRGQQNFSGWQCGYGVRCGAEDGCWADSMPGSSPRQAACPIDAAFEYRPPAPGYKTTKETSGIDVDGNFSSTCTSPFGICDLLRRHMARGE